MTIGGTVRLCIGDVFVKIAMVGWRTIILDFRYLKCEYSFNGFTSYLHSWLDPRFVLQYPNAIFGACISIK